MVKQCTIVQIVLDLLKLASEVNCHVLHTMIHVCVCIFRNSNVKDAAVVSGFILLSEARSMKSHVRKKRGLSLNSFGSDINNMLSSHVTQLCGMVV